MTLNVGDVYNEQGASAKDDTDGDISSKIKTSGVVNTSKPGTYPVTYEVTNSQYSKIFWKEYPQKVIDLYAKYCELRDVS